MKVTIEKLLIVFVGVFLSIITAGPWDDLFWENDYLNLTSAILGKIFLPGFLVVTFALGGPHGLSVHEITISAGVGAFIQLIIMYYVIRLVVKAARNKPRNKFKDGI